MNCGVGMGICRRAGAAGGGGSNLLLDGLVASWDLVANANDLHANALHFSEVEALGGDIAYGANGAFNTAGVGTTYLERAVDPLTTVGDQDFFLTCELKIDDLDADTSQVGPQMDGGMTSVAIYYSAGTHKIFADVLDPDLNYVQIQYAVGATGRYHCDYWYDHNTDTLSLSVNGGAAATASLVGGVGFDPDNSGGPILALSMSQLRYARLWTGANAIKDATQRDWMRNSGSGRTYAALAAGM